jgi:hypothetical protein
MRKFTSVLAGMLVPAFIAAGIFATPVIAQDKAKDAKAAPAKAEKGKPITKELGENDKVRAFEVTFRPGDVGPQNTRPVRVIRALKGGTLMRTYADGKTEEIAYKTGEVRVFEADSKPYTLTNVGKSDLALYAVFVKAPK